MQAYTGTDVGGAVMLEFTTKPHLMQLGSSDELEGKFAVLEGDDVDAELSAMKKGLLSSKSKQSLPEGRSESAGRPYK